jgi:uncharacterized NAD-dependent epimerase/dehydratase family protein
MITSKNKVIIFAQDAFGIDTAKTAIGFIKYGLCETVGIVDKKFSGKAASEIINSLPPIPVFSSTEEAKNKRPDADVLLIGIAPSGGSFPTAWLPEIKKSINLKLNIVNGLHDFLSNIPEIVTLAKNNNVFIWDVRKPEKKYAIANARLLDYPMQIVLTVGTDGAIGKMTVALELTKSARQKGKSACFIATGQTGMMISGHGIPVDAIPGDFMAGAVEEELIKAAKQNYSIAFVEGQGSILHPGWSGVTLALLHGAIPHKLILCHKAGREYIKNTKVKIESLKQFIEQYESLSLPMRKAKVVGICLNTFGLDDNKTKDLINACEDETGLPADDPVKNSGDKLLNTCLK